MNSNRRGFLIGLAGALIAGTVSTSLIIPTKAMADPIIGKYAMAVKLQLNLIEQDANLKAFMTQNSIQGDWDSYHRVRRSEPYKEMHTVFLGQAEEMIEFLMKEFPPSDSPSAREQAKFILENRMPVNTMSEEELMTLLDTVVPIAIMKNCLGVHKMPFDTSRMKGFNELAVRYKHLIIA